MGDEISYHDSKKEAIEKEWRIWLKDFENHSNWIRDMSCYEKLQNLMYQSVEGEYWEILIDAYEKVPLARNARMPNCDPGNQTALHLLIARSTPKQVIEKVLRHVDRDDVKIKDKQGNTVLHAAAAAVGIENIDIWKLILSYFPDLIEECNEYGQTALSLFTSALSLFTNLSRRRWNTVVHGYDTMINTINLTTLPPHSTPLHLAVDSLNVVDAKTTFEQVKDKKRMLKIKDEKGNTALHLAANFDYMKDLCKCIVDACPELVDEPNCEGETPLFIAGKTRNTIDNYRILHKYAIPNTIDRQRGDGNTTLHHALLNEDFALAYYMIQKHPSFRSRENDDGLTPLRILANIPYLFRNRTPLTMVEHIIYSCIWVIDLEKLWYNECFNTVKRLITSGSQIMHRILSSRSFFLGDTKNPKDESESAKGNKENSKDTSRKPADEDILVGWEDILKYLELDEEWSLMTLIKSYIKKCMAPIKSFIKTCMAPIKSFIKTCMAPIKSFIKTCITPFMIIVSFLIKHILPGKLVRKIERMKRRHMLAYKIMEKLLLNYEASREDPHLGNATILIAAENGVTEMVEGILRINSEAGECRRGTDSKNAVLLVIEKRQADVYELLTNLEKKGIYIDKGRKDLEENNALHVAATRSSRQPWGMPTTMQVLWEIKWYIYVRDSMPPRMFPISLFHSSKQLISSSLSMVQYVRDSMPPHFSKARNKAGKTPADVFNESHKEQIKSLEGGGEWVNKTTQSCSVVASLITTVAFAAATTLPGGNGDEGAPNFIGKAAFNTFVVSTFVALCLSLISLIMFLTILISPYHDSEDLGRNLPEQLMGGISALLGSIGAMLISFWAAHIFFLKGKLIAVALPIYILVCLPILGTVKAQFRFYINLVLTVYRAKPRPWYGELTT